MLYPSRVHTLKEVTDIEELASLLTEHTWTLCTGFCLRADERTILFLNDSTGENGAQEYAVLDQAGVQSESITFGWCNHARAAELIRFVLAGNLESMGCYDLHIDSNPKHLCRHCR